MGEFLAMGGYGAYVWPAYLLTAAVMIGLAVITVRRLRENKQRLDQLGGHPRRRRGDESAREST
jgi:heme exporter protein D